MIKMTLFKVRFENGRVKKILSWDKKTLLETAEEGIASIDPITDLVGNTYQDVIDQEKELRLKCYL